MPRLLWRQDNRLEIAFSTSTPGSRKKTFPRRLSALMAFFSNIFRRSVTWTSSHSLTLSCHWNSKEKSLYLGEICDGVLDRSQRREIWIERSQSQASGIVHSFFCTSNRKTLKNHKISLIICYRRCIFLTDQLKRPHVLSSTDTGSVTNLL